MDKYKRINVTLLVTSAVVFLATYSYWEWFCNNQNCLEYTVSWILRPFYWGSIIWSIILGTLLFFPSSIFKKWLPSGTAGLLLMIFFVLDTDPRSSSFWFSFGRGQAAWFTGVAVSFFTGLFILGHYGYLAWKKRPLPSSWTRLLTLIPAGLIIYLVAIS